MSGGLMQLVAYGAQDIYLTGNPQITFFKVVYRRYTNFSLESIEQTFNGSADWGKKVTCNISRNGDLVHRTYLQVSIPAITVTDQAGGTATKSTQFRWLNWLGHTMIKTVELEIGGQRIDKHYSAWLHIWNELTQTAGHSVGYAAMVGNTPDLTSVFVCPMGTASKTLPGKTLYIPLQFWFCRNHGLALPLIALQYHEVKINLEFASFADCTWSAVADTTTPTTAYTMVNTAVLASSIGSASIFVDYIYLDTEERRRFAQVSHEYLIEQLQFTGDESATSTAYKVKLNFNHPVKELIWVAQKSTAIDAPVYGKQWYNFSDALYVDASGQSAPAVPLVNAATESWEYLLAGAGGGSLVRSSYLVNGGANPVKTAKLLLNGHDRFSAREGSYFNLVQPYQHHTNVPSVGINVYSFALLPEEHQPSGSCNMSRIDNATLDLQLTAAAGAVNIKVFAVNYNVLRIMSGMGGLAYAN
jgi:hypothetical protein